MLYYEDIELGREHTSGTYTVNKDELIAFAKQWDPQPFHVDEEAAKHYPTGLIGTSVHSYAILTKLQTEMAIEQPAVVAGLGIDEWRTPNPLRPGDTVHAVGAVVAKRESNSKPNLGIISSVSTLYNQNNDVILTYKSTGLILKRPVT
ncbi:MAG TPA: MaoC/PaaZ C-terminal domain-containing protein [Pseudomonadales bacterium]